MADISQIKLPDGVTYNIKDPSALHAHQSVTDGDPTLSWGTRSKVATIGSTDIHVTMPSNPNTDTTYTLTVSGSDIKLTGSNGSSNQITVPYASRSASANSAGSSQSVEDSENANRAISISYAAAEVSTADYVCAWSSYNIRKLSMANLKSELGLKSAAYLDADTAASANTVVKRTADKYIYCSYLNTTCGEANPSSYTNPRPCFVSSDNWIRRSTAANFKTMLGLSAFTPAISNSEGSVSIANGGESAYTTMKTLSLSSGRMYIIFWNVEFQGGNNAGWGAGKIETSGDTLYGDNRSFRCKLNSDNYHTVNGLCFIKTTAARTITLKACQTSGAAKTAYGKVCALALPTNIYS